LSGRVCFALYRYVFIYSTFLNTVITNPRSPISSLIAFSAPA
jgi:hypothetical protein